MDNKKGITKIPSDAPVDKIFTIQVPKKAKLVSVEKDGTLLYYYPVGEKEIVKRDVILLSPKEDDTTFEVHDGWEWRKIGKVQRGNVKLSLCTPHKKSS